MCYQREAWHERKVTQPVRAMALQQRKLCNAVIRQTKRIFGNRVPEKQRKIEQNVANYIPSADYSAFLSAMIKTIQKGRKHMKSSAKDLKEKAE